MPRYFIYCRKSSESEDRQVLSIEAQQDELSRLANHRGLEVAEVLSEAKSAKAPGRPIFSGMLARLKRGEAQGIICWKPDRLARNPVDGGEILWLMKTHGIEIVTPAQTFRQGDDNKILLYIEFGMGEKYIDDLSKNVKRGNRAKLERGGWPHAAPPGYLNDRLTKTVVKDPDRFLVIREAWNLLLSGSHSVMRILSILNDKWGYRTPRGRPLARASLYLIFRNRFYYGVMEDLTGSYAGNHEPMITEEEFWRAQEILGVHGRPRPRHYVFPYSGLIRCGECGCMITAENKVNRRYGYRYTYYHCTRRRPCGQRRVVEARALERQMEAFLSRLALPPMVLEWAFQYLDEPERDGADHRQAVRRNLESAIGQTERALSNLTIMRARELIPDDDFLRERGRLQRELTGLKAQRPAFADPADVDQATADTFFLAALAARAFREGGPETRRELLQAVCSNLRLQAKILSIEAKKQFRAIDDGLDALARRPGPFEPPDQRFTMRDFAILKDRKETVWALVDEVRTFFQGDVGAEGLSNEENPSVTFREQMRRILRDFGVLRQAA